eukprot:5692861-Amphidinium_carterae.4
MLWRAMSPTHAGCFSQDIACVCVYTNLNQGRRDVLDAALPCVTSTPYQESSTMPLRKRCAVCAQACHGLGSCGVG